MSSWQICALETRDVRIALERGAGSDAVHSGAQYAFATTLLAAEDGLFGTGIVLNLGTGNELVGQNRRRKSSPTQFISKLD